MKKAEDYITIVLYEWLFRSQLCLDAFYENSSIAF